MRNDLISRKETMKYITEEYNARKAWTTGGLQLAHIETAVNRVPRAKGCWITIKKGEKGYSAGDFRCSVCGAPNKTFSTIPNFCSNCGADMRKETTK